MQMLTSTERKFGTGSLKRTLEFLHGQRDKEMLSEIKTIRCHAQTIVMKTEDEARVTIRGRNSNDKANGSCISTFE